MDENNSNNNLEENENNPEQNEVNKEIINNTEINNVTKNTVKEVTKKEEKIKYVEKKDKNKRKGDREIVVEYRKPSIFTSILLILIGALIATIVLLSFYIYKENKKVDVYDEPQNNVEETDNNQKEDEKGKVKLNLSPNGDFINMLYKKLSKISLTTLVYNNDITNYDTLSDNERLLFIFMNCKPEFKSVDNIKDKLDNKFDYEMYTSNGNYSVDMFKIDDVTRAYQSVYGVDKEVPLIDVETHLGYVYEYVAEDNCFYGHSYQGGGGSSFIYKTKISNCDQNDDGSEIYIYDLFIAASSTSYGPEGNKWSIYNDAEQKNVVKSNILEEFIDGESKFENKTKEELLNSYLESNGRKYKHTFRLDSVGNYYWYSSEPVE